jgi:hypothetical protein
MQLDPFTTDVLAGLMVSAVTGVARQVGAWRTTRSRQRTTAHAPSLQLDSRKLTTRLNNAIAAYSDLPSHYYPALRTFLQSPEMSNVARQLLSATIAGQTQRYLESIRNELNRLLELSLGVRPDVAAHVGGLLVEAIGELSSEAAEKLRDLDTIAARDIRRAASGDLILNHLQNIDKVVTHLAGHDTESIQDIHQFEVDLRTQIRHRHRMIVPPNFDHHRRVPITQLYVPPRFISLELSRSEAQLALPGDYSQPGFATQPRRVREQLTAEELIAVMHRTVVLGDPGAGKTTFSTKLCYDLASNTSRAKVGGQRLTPILVVLREYGAERKRKNTSIRDYVLANVGPQYQIGVPKGAIDYLLLMGRALLQRTLMAALNVRVNATDQPSQFDEIVGLRLAAVRRLRFPA